MSLWEMRQADFGDLGLVMVDWIRLTLKGCKCILLKDW